MKKHLIIVLLSIMLLLSSCGTENSSDFSDLFYLTMCDRTICKLNVQDGTLTTLCADPLCDHTIEHGCPLSGCERGYVWGGTFYFTARTSQATGTADELRAYDFDSSQVRIVCRLPEHPQNGGGGLGFRGGYYFEDFSASDTDFCLRYSVHLEDGKIEEYDGDMPAFPETYYKKVPLYVDMTDDWLHGKIRLGETVLYDGEIAITFTDQITNGKLLYGVYHRGEDGRVNVDEMSLYTLDLDSGESRMFCEKFNDVNFALFDGWMYYIRYVDDPPVIGYDKNQDRDIVNLSGGVIWRMNIGTGEEERYLSIPDYRLIGHEIAAVGDRIVIAYHNTDYSVWEEIPDSYHGDIWYEYPETCGWIIFDPANGTWCDVPAVLDGKPCKNTSRFR